MKLNKKVINSSKRILLKSNRRYFFKCVGLFSYLAATTTLLHSKEDESIDENELFLVDGWVLKKGDIHDL